MPVQAMSSQFFSRRMLWELVPKALLKSKKTTSRAFPSSSKWITLSEKEIKLVKQDLLFRKPC